MSFCTMDNAGGAAGGAILPRNAKLGSCSPVSLISVSSGLLLVVCELCMIQNCKS